MLQRPVKITQFEKSALILGPIQRTLKTIKTNVSYRKYAIIIMISDKSMF